MVSLVFKLATPCHPGNMSRRPPSITVPGRPCPAAATLQIVGERWSLLVVRELLFGVHRFDPIARNTGAPRDRLTARLRSLEETGIVERRTYQQRPPRHEYHLTEAGRDLAPVVFALFGWGDRWLFDESPATLHHRAADGHEHVLPLDAPRHCPTCDEPLRPEDVVPRRNFPAQATEQA